jgi:hypothetical protein
MTDTPTQTATAVPCLSFALPVPQIPAIFLPTFGASITFPPPLPFGIPCCHFSLPSFTLAIALPPLPIGPIIAALNAEIRAALAILPTIQIPQCNF